MSANVGAKEIVTEGLVLYLDAANYKSYTSGSSTWEDLSTLKNNSTINGTFSYTTTNDASCIRLFNTSSVSATNNVSRINCPTIQNVVTISMWYYQHGSSVLSRYLLDARTGGATAYIFSGGSGTEWASGTLYKNAVSLPLTWNNIETINVWQNIVVIANTSISDDINLFSRFSNNEGLNVSVSNVQIYNRALSAAEILQNYNALKGRFGLT